VDNPDHIISASVAELMRSGISPEKAILHFHRIVSVIKIELIGRSVGKEFSDDAMTRLRVRSLPRILSKISEASKSQSEMNSHIAKHFGHQLLSPVLILLNYWVGRLSFCEKPIEFLGFID